MRSDSSVHQYDSSRVASTAAYILFYRRQSSQPLGPPYLQELVNKGRNSGNGDSADASDAEDDSGEDVRLGGRSSASSRLLGSSSAGTAVAGATTETRLREGESGHGNAANPAARLRETSDDEGYQSASALTNHAQTWNFTNLPDGPNDVSNNSTNSPADTASDRPTVGSEYAESVGHRLADDFNDDNDDMGDAFGESNWVGPDNDEGMFNDVGGSEEFADTQEHPSGMSMVRLAAGEAHADGNDPPVKDINLDEE